MTSLDMMKRTVTNFNPWVFFDGSFLELGLGYKDFYVIFIFILVLLVAGVMQERGIRIREKIAEQNLYFRWLLYIGAVVVLLIYGSYAYFQLEPCQTPTSKKTMNMDKNVGSFFPI